MTIHNMHWQSQWHPTARVVHDLSSRSDFSPAVHGGVTGNGMPIDEAR